MEPLIECLNDKILVLNNSMESYLQRYVSENRLPIFLNLSDPEKVLEAYREYIQAGADIILTNTSGAIRPILKKYGASRDLEAINIKGVEIARQASENHVYIGGKIESAGINIEPFGSMEFDEAVEIYNEQIRALLKAGIDLLFIDSMTDIQDLRAAVIAANSLRSNIPLIVHATFDENGFMDSGTDIETFAAIMEGLNVDVIGVNCSNSLNSVIKDLSKYSNLPISVELSSDNLPEIFEHIDSLVEAGVNIVGGGCGIMPEHIRIVADSVKGKKVNRRKNDIPFRITSRTTTVRICAGLPFVKIGERINPTGRKSLAGSISEGRTDLIVKEAISQYEHGADALDVNIGVPMTDEIQMMQEAVKMIQDSVPIPLVLDSASPSVIEAGLKRYAGKALVNSVNGKEKQIRDLLPIVKKYGASVIALTIADTIPETAEDRLEIAKVIVSACEDYGIKRENIIVDAAALAVATSSDSGQQILNAVRLIKQELGLPVSLGVSNVSFGLPSRALIHNTFLVQAIAMGLDAAILNPLDKQVHEIIAAASLFAGRDKYCMNFIKMIRSKKA